MDPTKTRIWNADKLGLSAPVASDARTRRTSAADGGASAARSRSTSGGHERSRAAAQVTTDDRVRTVAPERADNTLPSHRSASAQPRSMPTGPVTEASALGPAPARKASSGPPPPPPPRRARGSQPPPAPSSLTTRWSANANAPGPLASTRVMPIELLLLSKLPQPSAAAPPPRFRMMKRIAGHVALATLTVLAIALWKLPLRQGVSARSLQPSAAVPAAHGSTTLEHERARADALVRGEPPAAARIGSAREHENAPAEARGAPTDHNADPRARAAAATKPAGQRADASLGFAAREPVASRRREGKLANVSSQRQAIELVIAGDFTSAEQAYRQLASEHPDGAVFEEAARILAARRKK